MLIYFRVILNLLMFYTPTCGDTRSRCHVSLFRERKSTNQVIK